MNKLHGLKHLTLKGLSWSLIANIIRQVLTFVIGVCLARILSPKEFGIVGMVIVFTGFVNIFIEQGLGTAIIQKQDINESHLNSIFCLNIFFGVLCTLILSFASPFIAKFYQMPILKPVIIFLSFNFFISAFNVVQNALLHKNIDFKRLAVIETIAVLFSGIVGIVLALRGFGVWSLAWQALLLTFLTVVVMWISSSWRPKLQFDFVSIKEILGFSGNLLGFNVLNYWVRNFDNLIVGKFLGSIALGLYSKAYQLMLMPLNQVSNVVSRVMFPVLCSIKHDKSKVKTVYLRVIRSIALITFPLMIWLFVMSRHFVLGIFGEKWSDMIPIFRIFCLVGMTQSIGTTVGWIYNSQGRTDLQLKWGIFAAVVYLTSFILGLHWGVLGVAWAYCISGYAILLYPSLAIPGRLINLRFTDILTNLSGVFYCSFVMGFLVWFIGSILPVTWQSWQYLVLQVLFGVVLYGILIHFFKIQAYREVKEIVVKYYTVRRNSFNEI